MPRDHYRTYNSKASRVNHEGFLDKFNRKAIKPIKIDPKMEAELRKEKTIDFEPIDQDLVIVTIATLSPSTNEPEQLIIIQEHSDGSYEYLHVDNDGDMTELSTNEEIYTKSPKNSLHDIHTHPSWSVHSAADLLILLKYPSVKAMHVVTPNSLVYSATRDKPFNESYAKISEKKLQSEIESETEKARLKVGSMTKLNLDLPPGSANDKEMAANIIAMRSIGMKYGFKYTASLQDKKLYDSDLNLNKETEL